jgi:tRNA1(Val) A37 N6-methylase TrmN6
MEYSTTEFDEDLCYLVGHWKIFQKIDKHRYSTDDLVTSWISVRESKSMGQIRPLYLDIGCGIGSVLLSNAWQLPYSTCYGVEVQPTRYELAQRSIAYNLGTPEEQRRVHVINIDLRDSDALSNRCEVKFSTSLLVHRLIFVRVRN